MSDVASGRGSIPLHDLVQGTVVASAPSFLGRCDLPDIGAATAASS